MPASTPMAVGEATEERVRTHRPEDGPSTAARVAQAMAPSETRRPGQWPQPYLGGPWCTERAPRDRPRSTRGRSERPYHPGLVGERRGSSPPPSGGRGQVASSSPKGLQRGAIKSTSPHVGSLSDLQSTRQREPSVEIPSPLQSAINHLHCRLWPARRAVRLSRISQAGAASCPGGAADAWRAGTRASNGR